MVSIPEPPKKAALKTNYGLRITIPHDEKLTTRSLELLTTNPDFRLTPHASELLTAPLTKYELPPSRFWLRSSEFGLGVQERSRSSELGRNYGVTNSKSRIIFYAPLQITNPELLITRCSDYEPEVFATTTLQTANPNSDSPLRSWAPELRITNYESDYEVRIYELPPSEAATTPWEMKMRRLGLCKKRIYRQREKERQV